MNITHDELAIKAGKWLKKTGIKSPYSSNCYIGVGLVMVQNRLMYNRENPDVIGFANLAENKI